MDAVRAAGISFVFPNQLIHDKLKPWLVPVEAYFYTAPKDAVWVNIDETLELKLSAAAAHVSQFEPSLSKYRPDWDAKDLDKMKQGLRNRQVRKDGHTVENAGCAGLANNDAKVVLGLMLAAVAQNVELDRLSKNHFVVQPHQRTTTWSPPAGTLV